MCGVVQSFLKSYEFINSQSSLLNDSTQCAFGNIFPGVVGKSSSPVSVRIIPDFMTPFGMAIEYKTSFTQFPDNLNWL